MASILIIDIGTNSILSLLAEFKDQKLNILDEQLYSPRLGETFHKTGQISKTSVKTAIKALKEILDNSPEINSQNILAVGTQIFRKAANSEAILSQIKKCTDLQIKVLTPDQEAYWGFQGAIADLSQNQDYVTLDIGGGSTEITLGNSSQIIHSESLAMGAVQLKDQYNLVPPVQSKNMIKAMDWINNQIKMIEFLKLDTNQTIIGIGGTVTTLAAMLQNLKTYEPDKIHQFLISQDNVDYLIKTMQSKTDHELKEWLKFDAKRSDIIYSGTLILSCFLKYFNCQKLQVSNHGLRYGLALSALKKGSF